MKNRKFLIVSLILIVLMLALGSAYAADLSPVANGTVSGGVDVATANPYASQTGGQEIQSGELSYDVPEDVSDVQYAGLFVNVYGGPAQGDYGAQSNVSITSNGETSQIASESLNYTDGTGDGTVHIVNDHITKVYSDYQMIYNITDKVQGATGQIKINVTNTRLEGNANFDGRIKLIGLVFAYNDGSNNKYSYWADSGQAWSNSADSVTKANFTVGTVSPFLSANIRNVALSSTDGNYSFNKQELTGGELISDSMFKYHKWDVTDLLKNKTNNLTFNSTKSFKNVLSVLTVTKNLEEIFVSPDGTGTGTTADDPTTMDKAAPALANNGIIHVLDGTYTQSKRYDIRANYSSIVAVNPGNVIFDGNNSVANIRVYGANVTLDGLTFTHGKTAGAGVYFDSDGNGGLVTNCIFRDINSSGAGGAVYISGSKNVMVENCKFINTTSTGTGGGAIYIAGDNATIKECSFENATGKDGGAIRVNSRDFAVVRDSNFTGCVANTGGAIGWAGKYGNVTNCTFTDNQATGSSNGGGAIYWQENFGLINNCTFIRNKAQVYGGAVNWAASKINGTIFNSIFKENSAGRDGGAYYSAAGANEMLIMYCSFEDNEADANGGAMGFRADKCYVLDCNFTGNHAKQNGSAVMLYSNVANFLGTGNCNFVDNSADVLNYSIVNNAGKLKLSENNITTNDLRDGIYTNGSILTDVYLYLIVNETNDAASNVVYANIGDEVPIDVYLVDDNSNLINGIGLSVEINGTNITEFDLDGYTYKTSYTPSEEGTYYVTGNYSKAELSNILTGSIVVGEEPVSAIEIAFRGEYVNTTYAGVQNLIAVSLHNTGSLDGNYLVEFYVDGELAGTEESKVNAGYTSDINFIDEKIRDLNESTILGHDNLQANYTVIVKDNETQEVIGESSYFPYVLYNGYLSKKYEYSDEFISSFRNVTFNGGYFINTTGSYSGNSNPGLTDIWTLPALGEGASFAGAYVYVAYTWDKTENGPSDWASSFNDESIPIVAQYRDQSNMGTSGSYGYGLVVYDVSSLIKEGQNKYSLTKGDTAIYPRTLVAFYNVTESSTVKTMYMYNGADLLYYGSYNVLERLVMTDSVLNISTEGNVLGSNLYVFAASAQAGEGNLLVNGEKYEDVWNGTTSSVEEKVFDLGDNPLASNEISFVSTGSTILALQQFVLVEYEAYSADVTIASEYNGACYAGTENALKVNVTNDGLEKANYLVELYADGVRVDYEHVEIDVGESNVLTLIDDIIRPVTENTVNGADNQKVNYTVYVSAAGSLLAEKTITPTIWYNGYLGKDYAYPNETISYFDTITVNGGVIIETLNDTTYMGATVLNRTDVWELDVPDDVEFADAFIYIGYNWDKTGANIPVLNLTFNGETVAPMESYRDQSNLGSSGKYGYGLIVYDVSGLVEAGENTLLIEKEFNKTAVYPSTLVAFYNQEVPDVITTVYMYHGADLLYNSYNLLGRDVESNSVLEVELVDDLASADLLVFAASAQAGEGNLIVNNETYENVWSGSTNSTNVFGVDILDSLKQSNEVSFVSTGGTILALQQFIVFEYDVTSAKAKVSTEYSNSAYAGTDNVLKLDLTNNGTVDTVYHIDLYADGDLVDSIEAEIDCGENSTLYLIDDTIRPVTENTINGNDNAKVNYTIVISDNATDEILDEITITPVIVYNGYLGKDYAYPNDTIQFFDAITVNGGVIIDTLNDTTYLGTKTTNRTDVWTVDVPNDAEFVEAFVYLAYNWDKTNGTCPVFNTTFNGETVTPIAHYRDQSNIGGNSAKYGYGLLVYDVSEYIAAGENSFELLKDYDVTAVYPSTLVAFYDVEDSPILTTAYMFNGADLLYNAYNFLGRPVESNSVLYIDSVDDIDEATLLVFAASGQAGEGNLIVNGDEYTNVWEGTSNSAAAYLINITDSIDESNNVSFVSTGGTILALQQFVIVSEYAPYAKADIISEYKGVAFAGTNNVLKVNVTNVAEEDAVFNVTLYADGVEIGSQLIEVDAYGSAIAMFTDEKIRPVTENTVKGADNEKVNYTAVIRDVDDLVEDAEATITPDILYNGNLGKDLAYPAEEITFFDSITVNGGIYIEIQNDTTYLASGATNRTDIWNIEAPEDADFVAGFVYVAYNWDKTSAGIPALNTAFNGVTVTPVAHYRDQSNMGTYGKYGYGLLVYDVSDLLEAGDNVFTLTKDANMTAIYPSVLVAGYDQEVSDSMKTIYMFNGADLLSNANNFLGRVVASNSVLDIELPDDVIDCALGIFAASSQKGEGNLIVNGESFEDVWNGSSNSVQACVFNLTDDIEESNTVSFVATGSTILALQQFIFVEYELVSVDAKLGSEYNNVTFAGTDNVLELNITNDGTLPTAYTIDFYIDGELENTFEVELANGESDSIYIVDPTIRPVDESTVNGADNAKVNYTVVITDNSTGDVLDIITLTPSVLYNGNLGKDLAYPAGEITFFDVITVNGDIIVIGMNDSTYLGSKTTGRTDVWDLTTNEEIIFAAGYLYVAYNWDKTPAGMPVWNTTFNGVTVTPVAHYRDQSNMGTYGKYGYGLIVYDVSDLIVAGENTFTLEKENGTTAVYPSTLVAFYNMPGSSTYVTTYLYNGADLLSNANNFLGRLVASNSTLNIDSFDNIVGADLLVFAASAQAGEGSLVINGDLVADIWNGSSNSVDAYAIDLGKNPKASNEVSFVATGSTILALQQFIVVEYNVPSAEASLVSEYSNVAFAGTNNVLQFNLTNNGALNTSYIVDFYIDGKKVNSTQIALNSGESFGQYFIDDTIRPVDASTVNGAANAKVNYTVLVSDKDTGLILDEVTLTPSVLYNGNLGKDLAYTPEEIVLFDTITVNGDVIIDTLDDSTYLGAKTTGRTDEWNLTVPSDADFEVAYLYVAYNWDKTASGMPEWNTTFNGVNVTPVAHYRDQSNMGTYGKYGYGLYIYDVSDLIKAGLNTFTLGKENGTTAVYPSTLVALYNVNESNVLTTVSLFNGADLLSNANNFLNRTVASNNVLELDYTVFDEILSSQLYVFAASAQAGEGNLIVNNKTFTNVWNGTSNSVDAYIVDLGNDPSLSNDVSFVATGSTILALEQFVVVKSKYQTSSDLQKLIDAAEPGSTLDLGDNVFQDVANVVIDKNLTIKGGSIMGKAGETIFVIPAKSANGPDEVNITGVDFIVEDANVIVQATADNGSSPTSIDTPNIRISDNFIDMIDGSVVPESVTVLKLDSERGVLAPTGELKVTDNAIAAGIKPFEFDVTGVSNGSDTNIPEGGNIPAKQASVIHYQDMETTAVNSKIEGRVGKYFEVNLTDTNGNPLANKFVQIGFNGVVYNRTTNETGGVKLQINLGYKGTYTFAISYLGDDYYNGSFVVSKIKVSTQNTKLTTAAKTYKASAKTKTLTATLKSSVYNKPINGKKVTFTVNGKSYSATTNAKGVATVKVSLSTKKTYSFTAKFAGDDMYTKSSVTGKVTIK